MNNISNFEAFTRKSIFAFIPIQHGGGGGLKTTRLSNSDNTIISTLQRSWVITDTIWKVWKDKLYVETQVMCMLYCIVFTTLDALY